MIQGTSVIRPENPSTGFIWEITSKDATVELVATRYISDEVDDEVVGGGGHRVWVFRGSGIVNLIHHRPWEGGEVDRTESLKISA